MYGEGGRRRRSCKRKAGDVEIQVEDREGGREEGKVAVYRV